MDRLYRFACLQDVPEELSCLGVLWLRTQYSLRHKPLLVWPDRSPFDEEPLLVTRSVDTLHPGRKLENLKLDASGWVRK